MSARTPGIEPKRRTAVVRRTKGATVTFRRKASPPTRPPGAPTPLPSAPGTSEQPVAPPAPVPTEAPPGGGGSPPTSPPTTPPTSPPTDPLEAALATGDAARLNNPGPVLDAALAEIDRVTDPHLATKVQLLDLNADGSARADGSSLTGIDWDPGATALLSGDYTRNSAVLLSQDGAQMALAGQGRSKYLVFAGNPFRQAYPFTWGRPPDAVNEQMQQFLRNSMTWLTGRTNLGTTRFNVVIAQAGQEGYHPDEDSTRWWLDQNYGRSNVRTNQPDVCDGEALRGCLGSETDLLIVSNYGDGNPSDIAAAVEDGMRRGIPVMYIHWQWDPNRLSDALMPLFDVNYVHHNYDWRLKVRGFDATATGQIPGQLEAVRRLLQNLRAGSWSGLDLSQCHELNCADIGLARDFSIGADLTLRGLLNLWDARGFDLFGQDGHRLEKLLVLLGDVYRRNIRYPLDHGDIGPFMRGYFADHVVYNNRRINPAQPDLGSFSHPIRNTVPTFTETVAVASRTWRYYTAAKVYALPGRTFTVERLDNDGPAVWVAVNTERPESTHEFAPGDDWLSPYDRPKFLRTPWMEVQPGRKLALTNPYGGPVQVAIAGTGLGSPTRSARLSFAGVGKHPVWDGPATTAEFLSALRSGDYNWAEVITPGFQLHSRLDYMWQSLQEPEHRTPEELLAVTEKYWYRSMFNLAGYENSEYGLSGNDAVRQVCADRGWDCDSASVHGLGDQFQVRHFNADRAVAGGGTPLEAYWAFKPLSWGDGHEAGHLLQRDRLKIYGGQSGEVSNNIFPTHNLYLWNLEHPGQPKHLENESNQVDVFKVLTDAQAAADPVAAVREGIWERTQPYDVYFWRLQFYYQLAFQAFDLPAFRGDGWNLYPLLYKHERLFSRALRSDADWLAQRDRLGFGGYSLSEAQGIDGNDYMLVATSLLTGRDQRPFFDMWGVTYQSGASAQVDSFGYPRAAKEFHVVPQDVAGKFYNAMKPFAAVKVTRNAQLPVKLVP